MTRSELGFTFRWLLYAVFIGLIALVPRLDIQFFINEYSYVETSEYTWLEICQAIFLGLSCFLFALSSRPLSRIHHGSMPSLSWVLSGFFSCLLIREGDYFLDMHVFDGAWQTLVTIILVCLFTYSWLEREQIAQDLRLFVKTNSFGIIAAGLLTLVIYSRLFGMGEFWQDLMNKNYIRQVKDIAEEGIELLGTAIIFIGSIEFMMNSLRARPDCPEPTQADHGSSLNS